MRTASFLAVCLLFRVGFGVGADEAQALKDAEKLGGFDATVDESRAGKPVVGLRVRWTPRHAAAAGLDHRAFGAAADAAMIKVAGLKELRELSLDLPVTDAGLKRLVGLSTLHTLAVPRSRVTDAGLAHLAALDSLESLDLTATAVTDAGLKHLAKLKRLRALSLRGTAVTDAGLKDLA